MTMQDEVIAIPTPHKRVPWNKGKLTGAKPPLRPRHVWGIRTKRHHGLLWAAAAILRASDRRQFPFHVAYGDHRLGAVGHLQRLENGGNVVLHGGLGKVKHAT